MEPTATASERLWTPQDVAKFFNRSVSWVRERTAEGALPVVDAATIGTPPKPGEKERRRAPLYRPEAIRELVEQKETPALNPYGRSKRGSAA